MEELIITKITGGIGNQLFQYAAGRRLAYKLNTELKLDNSLRDTPNIHPFGLDKFNINATFATPEEIASLKKINPMTQQGYFMAKADKYHSLEEILNAPDNTYLQGWWIKEAYFKDISDVLRKDLTLKEPLSPNAEAYRQKILSAECPVSMHFRHGDYVYNPYYKGRRGFAYIPPLERYCDCVNLLKPIYKNLTVFVFSNNIPFIKDNLHLDVPIEFIENCANDVEELYLMSLCKHCIKPNSTFSWWASWLNQNLGKKTFQLNPSDAKTVENWHSPLSAEKRDLPMWINVPFDKDHDLQNIEMTPIFSLLLVVNNDAATIAETLDSLLAQDYKYHEVIIIDNASTDGSREICRQKIEGKKNFTFKKLHTKEKNAKAWNIALGMAKGLYVSFLKGNDRFLANALTTLYFVTERRPDVIAPFVYLEENASGTITIADKKYSVKRDAKFPDEKQGDILTKEAQDAAKLLFNQQINSILSMKVFYRQFLEESKIKFDKQLDDANAELFFQLETFFKARFLLYNSKALYIAPKND